MAFSRRIFIRVCVCFRGWFSNQGSVTSLTGSELSSSSSSSMDLGSGEGAMERWGMFGPRQQVHKSMTDPGIDHGTAGKNLPAHDAFGELTELEGYP